MSTHKRYFLHLLRWVAPPRGVLNSGVFCYVETMTGLFRVPASTLILPARWTQAPVTPGTHCFRQTEFHSFKGWKPRIRHSCLHCRMRLISPGLAGLSNGTRWVDRTIGAWSSCSESRLDTSHPHPEWDRETRPMRCSRIHRRLHLPLQESFARVQVTRACGIQVRQRMMPQVRGFHSGSIANTEHDLSSYNSASRAPTNDGEIRSPNKRAR